MIPLPGSVFLTAYLTFEPKVPSFRSKVRYAVKKAERELRGQICKFAGSLLLIHAVTAAATANT